MGQGVLMQEVIAAGSAFHYVPGTVHRVTAIEDTTILEVSTPHLGDVVRLEDRVRPRRHLRGLTGSRPSGGSRGCERKLQRRDTRAIPPVADRPLAFQVGDLAPPMGGRVSAARRSGVARTSVSTDEPSHGCGNLRAANVAINSTVGGGGSSAPAGRARMLRYLEEHGLVVPRRTASGYRLYGLVELNRLQSLRSSATGSRSTSSSWPSPRACGGIPSFGRRSTAGSRGARTPAPGSTGSSASTNGCSQRKQGSPSTATEPKNLTTGLARNRGRSREWRQRRSTM